MNNIARGKPPQTKKKERKERLKKVKIASYEKIPAFAPDESGKIVAKFKVGDTIVIERFRATGNIWTICSVTSINGDHISLRDETLDQDLGLNTAERLPLAYLT